MLAFSPLLPSRSKYNVVSKNNITNNTVGVDIWGAVGNIICCNIISNDYRNVMFDSSKNNILYGNLITDSEYGFWLFRSGDNHIYHNVFIDNAIQAYIQDIVSRNIWDNDHPSGGNYWSDYNGTDVARDGIGDTPYMIDTYNKDSYPLVAPINVFDVGAWNGVTYNVNVISNSTISSFQLDLTQRRINFNVTGLDHTLGFCRVTIPNVIVQELWEGNYTILVDGKPSAIRNWTDDTYTYIYFTYAHDTHKVTIIPEVPSSIILPLFMVFTLLIVALTKGFIIRKRVKRLC